MAASAATCLTHWVTMATLSVDSTVLEFGFPLPAFRAGTGSGTWTANGVALAIDWLFALFVSVPVVAVALRRMRRRRVFALGVAAVVLTGALHAEPLLILGLGFHKLRWQAPERTQARCRALWIGTPVRAARDADPENPCVSR